MGLCVPAADLARAIDLAGNLKEAALSNQRHENSVKLASVLTPRLVKGVAQPGDSRAAEFLRATTDPSIWLASFDACLFLDGRSPAVLPFREALKKADGPYREPPPKIARKVIDLVGKIRDAGLPLTCADLLGSSLTWVPPDRLDTPNALSFLALADKYEGLRLGDGLGHDEAIARMLAEPPALPPPAKPAPAKAPRPRR